VSLILYPGNILHLTVPWYSPKFQYFRWTTNSDEPLMLANMGEGKALNQKWRSPKFCSASITPGKSVYLTESQGIHWVNWLSYIVFKCPLLNGSMVFQFIFHLIAIKTIILSKRLQNKIVKELVFPLLFIWYHQKRLKKGDYHRIHEFLVGKKADYYNVNTNPRSLEARH
jgi:hypothetical protein